MLISRKLVLLLFKYLWDTPTFTFSFRDTQKLCKSHI